MRLPQDLNAVPLPGFTFLSTPARATVSTSGATSASDTIPTGSAGKFVVVRVSAPVFLNFGTGAAVAAQDDSSMLWAGSELIVKVPPLATHFAIIRVGAVDVICQLELLSDHQSS